MNDRAQLLRAVQAAHRAGNGQAVAEAVRALEEHDRHLAAYREEERSLDLAQRHVAARFQQGPMNGDRHTWATDWIGDLESGGLDPRVAMRAEASQWVRSLHPDVRRDREEFTAQATGVARSLASAYGEDFPAAYNAFLAAVREVTAASGLPQIDQMIDPNNQPSATPYPTEVFDNFAPEQNDYNGGVESPNRNSSIDSNSAPMFQQLRQMDGSGSGFGTGPEKPSEHDTAFDTQFGYAEVPLGTPGTIPSAGPGQGTPVGQSAPTPLPGPSGQPLGSDGDEDDRQRTGSAHYSVPDPHGFRWLASTSEVFHPYHERCAASHWPDEDCTQAIAHTGSLAIGYQMDLAQAQRVAAAEEIGRIEGRRTLYRANGSLIALAERHNQVAAGWGKSARTMEDTAVLRGFQAVVRPVLADGTQGCSKCRLGATTIVNGQRLCGDHARQARDTEHQQLQPHTSGRQITARDFSMKERRKLESEGDTLPGTTKLPVKTKKDLKNAEELKGKVKGASDAEIESYLNRKKKELSKKGFQQVVAALLAEAESAGRLDFPGA